MLYFPTLIVPDVGFSIPEIIFVVVLNDQGDALRLGVWQTRFDAGGGILWGSPSIIVSETR